MFAYRSNLALLWSDVDKDRMLRIPISKVLFFTAESAARPPADGLFMSKTADLSIVAHGL